MKYNLINSRISQKPSMLRRDGTTWFKIFYQFKTSQLTNHGKNWARIVKLSRLEQVTHFIHFRFCLLRIFAPNRARPLSSIIIFIRWWLIFAVQVARGHLDCAYILVGKLDKNEPAFPKIMQSICKGSWRTPKAAHVLKYQLFWVYSNEVNMWKYIQNIYKTKLITWTLYV